MGSVGIGVLPVFWMTMRKTTLLVMLTGVLVGLSKVFVTVSAGWVLVTKAKPLPTVAPEFAEMELEAVPDEMAVNRTAILVDWPGVSVPRFVHVSELAVVLEGGRLADWKVRRADGKLSISETFVSEVLPVLMTWRLNWTVSPTSA